MFFIPRGNKLYCIIARWPSYARYAIVSLFFIIIVLAWWLIAYVPLRENCKMYKNEIALLSGAKKITDIMQQCTAISHEIDSLAQSIEITARKKKFLSHHDIAREIIIMLTTSGIMIESIEVGNLIKKEFYSLAPITLSIRGSFYVLMHFITSVSELGPMASCSYCKMTTIENNNLACTCVIQSCLITINESTL
ncbi:MAG: type 4a pilus biogenesis protein PilO [Candidatus Babeliaceae bacterium]